MATAAELRAAGLQDSKARVPRLRYYSGQAGWDGCEWGGVWRDVLLTADWATVDPKASGAVDAGDSEGHLFSSSAWTAQLLRSLLRNRGFAGVVCVRAD